MITLQLGPRWPGCVRCGRAGVLGPMQRWVCHTCQAYEENLSVACRACEAPIGRQCVAGSYVSNRGEELAAFHAVRRHDAALARAFPDGIPNIELD